MLAVHQTSALHQKRRGRVIQDSSGLLSRDPVGIFQRTQQWDSAWRILRSSMRSTTSSLSNVAVTAMRHTRRQKFGNDFFAIDSSSLRQDFTIELTVLKRISFGPLPER